MATLTTRAGKGSALTHNELDANFKRTVSQKTTTYSIVESDNRSVIECNSATPFTVTLGAATTMAAADTGDFEVTITNIGTGAATVARAGSDTINGAATSKVLQQYEAMTFKVNSAGTGYVAVAQSSNITTAGTVEAYKPIIADANKDTTGHRNITATGAVTAGSLSLTTDLSVANGGTGASTANAARENLGIYHGAVSNAGAAFRLPSGWSSTRNSTGTYTITHNFASNSYQVVISNTAWIHGAFEVYTTDTNSFVIKTYDSSFALADASFSFILIKE